MKLTEHFTLASMLRSQKATRQGYTEQFNPSAEIIACLKALCVNVLEPIRLAVGKPIMVSSGYRCERTNKAIGSKSKNSQHLFGQAADIEIEGLNNAEIISAIKRLDLPVDQCIEEFNEWVHVSYGPRNRKEFLKAIINKKTKETDYIPY